VKRRDFFATLFGATVASAVGYLGTRGKLSVDEAIAQEEQVLSGAKERIEQHRKGEVTLVIQAPNGKPLPNAELTLAQTRHEFLFGCNIFRWGRIPDPKREELYRERLLPSSTTPRCLSTGRVTSGSEASQTTNTLTELWIGVSNMASLAKVTHLFGTVQPVHPLGCPTTLRKLSDCPPNEFEIL
jgi:hypothetical protein